MHQVLGGREGAMELLQHLTRDGGGRGRDSEEPEAPREGPKGGHGTFPPLALRAWIRAKKS